MDKERYRKIYTDFGLAQTTMAEFLGYAARTSRRWALGESDIPLEVDLLLEIMVKYKITPNEARELASLPHMGEPLPQNLEGKMPLLMLIAICKRKRIPAPTLNKYVEKMAA